MQRKILLTLTAASTLAVATLWRPPLVNRLVREVECYGPSTDHRGADTGRAP